MIKPRFSICKKKQAMASATLAYGIWGNRGASPAAVPAIPAVRDGRNLLERTLDPDSTLVARCLRGEETAWEELVRVYTRKVYGLCYRFTNSASEAQDLTQEVFLRVFKTVHSFRCDEGS